MKRKVFIIVSCIELIVSLYYVLTNYRDGLTELFITVNIFIGAVLSAFIIKFVLDCFVFKSSWIPSLFIHCLTCPGIFFITCMIVPDYAKDAFESYHFREHESEYSLTTNTFFKEFHSSINIEIDGHKHFVSVDGEYVKDGQTLRLLSKSISYNYTPVSREEEMFFDSFKKDLYMDKDSIYGLNGKNYALN
ncbi:MAG: hypothetical protein K6E54_01870 [Bacteroidaceae bacterium]|nr:hypothetical protein [Bacteroidaceae bacterium]